MLNTATAKMIAMKRHRRTVAFLSALEEELSLKDLGIRSIDRSAEEHPAISGNKRVFSSKRD
jgi:uncharacterized protein YjiS (DUF1127 family)